MTDKDRLKYAFEQTPSVLKLLTTIRSRRVGRGYRIDSHGVQAPDHENALWIKFCGECGQYLADAQGAAPLPRLRTYTHNRLAERILAEQAAMEARGAQDGEFGFLRCGTTEARILPEPRYPASGESPIHGSER